MRWSSCTLLALVGVTVDALKVPATVVIDGGRLHAARAQIVAGKACAPLKSALTALKKDADSWLGKGPWSVIDKGVAAPGGTIHDYLSKAPYFWPSKNKTADNVRPAFLRLAQVMTRSQPQGCPYVEKGERVTRELCAGRVLTCTRRRRTKSRGRRGHGSSGDRQRVLRRAVARVGLVLHEQQHLF